MNRQNVTNIPAARTTVPIIADRPDGIHPDYMVNSGASVDRTMNSYPGSPAAKEAAREEVVPEFLRTLVFARPRGDDQFADCTFSPSLDMSR